MSCGTIDYDGNFIFGHQFGNASQFNSLPEGTEVGNGLMAISATRQAGYQTIGADRAIQDNLPLESLFRSRWHDFGYGAIKKQIHYLYLYCYTTGQQDVNITYYRDGDWHVEDSKINTQSATVKMERADHKDQPNYAASSTSTGDFLAKWDQDFAQEPILTEIRIPVAMKNVSSFGFELSTSAKLHFIGYSIEYTPVSTQTIKGKS